MASLSDALVKQLLGGKYIASIATQNPDGSIHMVAVWFWFDGSHVFVGTSSRSRKARNVQAKATASLMIDARDPAASCGVTVTGAAYILTDDASRQKNKEIHHKYLSGAALADPKVGPVFAAFDDVTIQIAADSVITWDMQAIDQQFFGGSIGKHPTYLLPLEP